MTQNVIIVAKTVMDAMERDGMSDIHKEIISWRQHLRDCRKASYLKKQENTDADSNE